MRSNFSPQKGTKNTHRWTRPTEATLDVVFNGFFVPGAAKTLLVHCYRNGRRAPHSPFSVSVLISAARFPRFLWKFLAREPKTPENEIVRRTEKEEEGRLQGDYRFPLNLFDGTMFPESVESSAARFVEDRREF